MKIEMRVLLVPGYFIKTNLNKCKCKYELPNKTPCTDLKCDRNWDMHTCDTRSCLKRIISCTDIF